MATRDSVARHAPPPGPIALTVRPRLPPDWPASGLGDIGLLAGELPSADSLPSGSWVAVASGQSGGATFWARVTRRPSRHVHLAVRATALLLRGYANVCADDAGTAFGQVP